MIFDLGFTTKEQRDIVYNRDGDFGLDPEIHYLNALTNIRKQRVVQLIHEIY